MFIEFQKFAFSLDIMIELFVQTNKLGQWLMSISTA